MGAGGEFLLASKLHRLGRARPGLDLRKLFATNLRHIRYQRKLSQERLAHDVGVDPVYMSRVGRAVTYVGLEIIGKLADVLAVDPIEFFRRPTRSGPRKKG